MTQRRPTKRTLLKAALFIVAGAIINVAVAWGCAWHMHWHYGNPIKGIALSDSESRAIWKKYEPDAHSYRMIRGGCGLSIGARQVLVEAFGEDTQSNAWGIREKWAGWPVENIQGASIYDIRGHSYRISMLKMRPFGELPCNPIWPGFAINTIFYAGVLWLLFTAPGFVRRRIRIMRHHCPACAYPIGTNPRCTECGKPVTGQ